MLTSALVRKPLFIDAQKIEAISKIKVASNRLAAYERDIIIYKFGEPFVSTYVAWTSSIELRIELGELLVLPCHRLAGSQ